MLEFKFDTKIAIAAFNDIPLVLRTIDGLSRTDRQAQIANGPVLVDPNLLDQSLLRAGVAVPSDPARAWRSQWNEIVLYGLVYWDVVQSPMALELTPMGDLVANRGYDLQDALLRTFSRLQYPHPLKDQESSLAPFLESGARVVPVRRAARVLVELEKMKLRGEISVDQAFLTDVELYYVWTFGDWLGIPDGDPILAARRIIDHRNGVAIPGQDLMTDVLGQHWLIRLPVKIGYLSKYFQRQSNPTRLELSPGATTNPLFVEYMLANTSYFAPLEQASTLAAGRVEFPGHMFSAWGLYHGGEKGNEHLSVLASSTRSTTVSLPVLNTALDYSFTFETAVWQTALDEPAELTASGRDTFLLKWIADHWLQYAYSFDTLVGVVDAVQLGNVLLQGPPGSGKTQLAELLATMFNACLIPSTATPDWSTADTVGGPSLSSEGALTSVAKNGIVTDAILDCARSVYGVKPLYANCVGQQAAVWLAIDEFNRAEIDRVFGGLFTAFSSSTSRTLELPFQDDVRRRRVRVPSRFRLVATANTLDKSYVNGMSQALMRRFSTIEIGIPRAPEAGWRLDLAVPALRAGPTIDYKLQAGTLSHEAVVALERTRASGVGESERMLALERIYLVVLALRYGFGVPEDHVMPHVPIGTAQVIDALAYAAHQIEQGDLPGVAASRALATRVLPQIDYLSRTQLLQMAMSLEVVGDSSSADIVRRMAERLPQLL